MTNCTRCNEPITDADTPAPILGEPLHYECGARMAVGSIAHIEKRCSCYVPGSDEGDPPGLTKRQAARLVLDALDHRKVG